MKKLLILFMAIGLVTVSCNNDKKGPMDDRNTNKDKDDYNTRDKDDDKNKDRDDDDDSRSGEWSSSDKSQWMKVCRDPLVESMGDTRATDYCECVMGKISKKYSTFQKANTQGTEQEGEEMGRECIKELGYQ